MSSARYSFEMKSASFIECVADAYRVERKTVALYTRLLKEAGFLTIGGRGRHAPHLKPIDAARITIALLATSKPARAPERLQRFRNLTFQSKESIGPFPRALGIKEGATLEEVLTSLFSSDIANAFAQAPYLEVHENTRRATIEFSNEETKSGAVFRDTVRTDEQMAQDRGERAGIRQSRGLASSDLSGLYVPFYCERRDGKPWEEIQVDLESDSVAGTGNALPIQAKALLAPYIIGKTDDG